MANCRHVLECDDMLGLIIDKVCDVSFMLKSLALVSHSFRRAVHKSTWCMDEKTRFNLEIQWSWHGQRCYPNHDSAKGFPVRTYPDVRHLVFYGRTPYQYAHLEVYGDVFPNLKILKGVDITSCNIPPHWLSKLQIIDCKIRMLRYSQPFTIPLHKVHIKQWRILFDLSNLPPEQHVVEYCRLQALVATSNNPIVAQYVGIQMQN